MVLTFVFGPYLSSPVATECSLEYWRQLPEFPDGDSLHGRPLVSCEHGKRDALVSIETIKAVYSLHLMPAHELSDVSCQITQWEFLVVGDGDATQEIGCSQSLLFHWFLRKP